MTNEGFAGMGLAPALVEGLAVAGYAVPTPVQAQAIPPQLAGHDILGIAQTSTGKTAAFALPILDQLLGGRGRAAPGTARALVLAPTRELAVQIEASFRALAGKARISTLTVFGGASRAAQVRALARGTDVVIATPGRLIDLIDDRHLRLDETAILVLDEADRMLDMGFIRPVQSIVRLMHPRRRTALFTATMPAEVEALAASLLRDPKRVEIARPGTPVVRIAETVLPLAQGEKRARLAALVGAPEAERVLVFARTKRGADRVAEALARDGFGAAAIHGNKAQNARQRALKDFAEGRVRILVATDIAARGIDVAGITHVIQYDLPDEPEAYVHRMGRTGRNGADGIAIAFCAPEEREKLRAIEKLTRRRLGAEEDRPARPAPARPAGKPQPGRPGPAKAPPRGALPQGEPTGRAAARRRRRRHGPAGAARGGSAAARVTAG